MSTNYAQKVVKVSLVEIFDQKRMCLINYVMYEYVYVSNVERDSNSNIQIIHNNELIINKT